MEKKEPILCVKNVSKSFPGVQALKGVNLRVYPGEVHALLGENGAGKSTLMKIVLGMYQPSSGEMECKGRKYAPKSPAEALANGISMIHQEISLVPTTTVSENIWIGRESRFGNKVFINKKKQNEATDEILKRLGLHIKPSAVVSGLSIAEMQLVEIARAVSYDSDIIIMDEPTRGIDIGAKAEIYKLMDMFVKSGKSIIIL